jgi:hypothetical protein
VEQSFVAIQIVPIKCLLKLKTYAKITFVSYSSPAALDLFLQKEQLFQQ